mmetsp:Transcript_26943/g.85408  ORF Transcript_26943/g.85408 Transcript_26943/m.85408 type:complete len:204 (-) Transcript_26943:1444-2055(-)
MASTCLTAARSTDVTMCSGKSGRSSASSLCPFAQLNRLGETPPPPYPISGSSSASGGSGSSRSGSSWMSSHSLLTRSSRRSCPAGVRMAGDEACTRSSMRASRAAATCRRSSQRGADSGNPGTLAPAAAGWAASVSAAGNIISGLGAPILAMGVRAVAVPAPREAVMCSLLTGTRVVDVLTWGALRVGREEWDRPPFIIQKWW